MPLLSWNFFFWLWRPLPERVGAHPMKSHFALCTRFVSRKERNENKKKKWKRIFKEKAFLVNRGERARSPSWLPLFFVHVYIYIYIRLLLATLPSGWKEQRAKVRGAHKTAKEKEKRELDRFDIEPQFSGKRRPTVGVAAKKSKKKKAKTKQKYEAKIFSSEREARTAHCFHRDSRCARTLRHENEIITANRF